MLVKRVKNLNKFLYDINYVGFIEAYAIYVYKIRVSLCNKNDNIPGQESFAFIVLRIRV